MLEYMDPIEVKQYRFKKLKKKLQKKFPGAKTSKSQDGRYYVSQKGVNLIGSKYPDLMFSPDVFTAWSNLETVEHWNRIEERNNRGFQEDINSISIQNSSESDYEAVERYLVNNPEIEE